MDARIDEVLELWFGPGPSPTTEIYERWFRRDPEFDAEIRRRFGALHAEAADGGLADWRGHARGELALIVVLDQFSRNLYRDDPRAFALDHEALALARELRRAGRAKELGFYEQLVALLPFQHAEDHATQIESVAAFESLVAEAMELRAGDDVIGTLRGAAAYARQHKATIDRFGRFPYRNAALGRASTPDERAFLDAST